MSIMNYDPLQLTPYSYLDKWLASRIRAQKDRPPIITRLITLMNAISRTCLTTFGIPSHSWIANDWTEGESLRTLFVRVWVTDRERRRRTYFLRKIRWSQVKQIWIKLRVDVNHQVIMFIQLRNILDPMFPDKHPSDRDPSIIMKKAISILDFSDGTGTSEIICEKNHLMQLNQPLS